MSVAAAPRVPSGPEAVPGRRPLLRWVGAAGLGIGLVGCGGAPATRAPAAAPPPGTVAPSTAVPSTVAPSTVPPGTAAPGTGGPGGNRSTTVPSRAPASTAPPGGTAASATTLPGGSRPPLAAASLGDGGPATFGPTATGPLTGKVVAIDPGHNGGNGAAPAIIGAPIFNGRNSETCDTAGASTNGGYAESRFNWNVGQYTMAALRAEGATVVLTRTTDTGVGPCVTQRAAIGNAAGAAAAVSIHADGGPPTGRGFAILEPVADGPNNAIIGPSAALAVALRSAFGTGTGTGVSTYDGVGGLQARSDLAGTNLSTVPKVFVECANMRNDADAALLTTTAWQQRAGAAIAAGVAAFVLRR